MKQPTWFIDHEKPHDVCKLVKTLYDLRQAPTAWYHDLRDYALQFIFPQFKYDHSLFYFRKDNMIFFFIYLC